MFYRGRSGFFEDCVSSRQSRLAVVVVQISQKTPGCAGKTAFVAQRWRRIALYAAVGLTCALEIRYYVVIAVEHPLDELITHDLLQALSALKTPWNSTGFVPLPGLILFYSGPPETALVADVEPLVPSVEFAAASNARSSLSFNFASSSLA